MIEFLEKYTRSKFTQDRKQLLKINLMLNLIFQHTNKKKFVSKFIGGLKKQILHEVHFQKLVSMKNWALP